MGRCQSTPGLVESRGRIPLEEMWISPLDVRGTLPYSISHSMFSPSPSPVVPRAADTNNVNNTRNADSPMSATSSGHSSEDATTRAPQSAATQPSTGRQSTHSGNFNLWSNLQLYIKFTGTYSLIFI